MNWRSKLRDLIGRAANDPNPQRVIDRELKRLGPIGKLAKQIARIFGGASQRRGAARDRRRKADQRDAVKALEDAYRQIERAGFIVHEDGTIEPKAPPPPPPPGMFVGEAPAVSEVPGVGERRTRARDPDDGPELDVRSRVRQSHDVRHKDWGQLTAWILTPQSSNVYAFAYDPVGRLLYVTYQEPDGSAGPMYSYGSVGTPFPESFYQALVNANSKGKWIWDNVRIRGTVFGHKFPYTLVRPGAGGYVPRKATPKGLRTRAVPVVRTVGNQRRTVLRRSLLPERNWGSRPRKRRR